MIVRRLLLQRNLSLTYLSAPPFPFSSSTLGSLQMVLRSGEQEDPEELTICRCSFSLVFNSRSCWWSRSIFREWDLRGNICVIIKMVLYEGEKEEEQMRCILFAWTYAKRVLGLVEGKSFRYASLHSRFRWLVRIWGGKRLGDLADFASSFLACTTLSTAQTIFQASLRLQSNMLNENGPLKFAKLPLGCRVEELQVGEDELRLLVATTERKLQSFQLQYMDKVHMETKALPVREWNVQYPTTLMQFSGQKAVHCQEALLKIDNHKQIEHKSKINHLLVDQSSIAVTTCEDSILISSVEKAEPLGELHRYAATISSVFWHHSLVISGDQMGAVTLWDINRQKEVHNHTLHAKRITCLGAYLDFVHTNVYYSHCSDENRLSFHDLRSYKPIKITNNLPTAVSHIKHTPTGKVLLMNEDSLSMIDFYKGFHVSGLFRSVSSHKLEDFRMRRPNSLVVQRKLKDLLIWDRHAIVGGSNGCIEIYNTDNLTCMYALGICQYSGVKSLKRIKSSLIVLQNHGTVSLAKLQ